VLALSGVLEFNKLSQNGYANNFYAAAVKSDLLSLRNFFFVSFDPGGLVSVDKPPLAIWLQTLSAKLFGFAPLSLIVPEGICAMLAVALLYFIVAKRLGILAGLVSAAALAVFPAFVAVSRENAVDPLLLLFMTAACGAGLRAVERGRLRWLLLSAVLIGLAFNTKSLAALLCVPGLGLAYLLCAQASWRRRILQLAAALVVLVVTAASWSIAVDLTPASQRPYVGGSTNNSEIQLEFGYNGFGRAGGQVGGPPCPAVYSPPTSDVPIFRPAGPKVTLPPASVSAGSTGTTGVTGNPGVTVRNPQPVPFASCNRDPLRVFGLGLGDQAGWTVPLAVVGLLGLALLAGGWRNRRTALLFAFGGWFVLELGFLDYSKGIVHPYYSSGLGPPLAAMCGAAVFAIVELVRSRTWWRVAAGLVTAAAAALGTVAAQLYEIHNHGYPHFMRTPLVIAALAAVALVGASTFIRRLTGAAGLLLAAALLAVPLIYTTSVWDAPVDGTFPTAGPYNEAGWGGVDLPPDELAANQALASYIRTHDPTHDFEVLTESSDGASPLILLGIRAAAMGGYNTTDPALSGSGLAALVAEHKARYVVVGGPYFQRGGNGASAAARLVCPQVPQAVWYPASPVQGTIHLVDCAGRAADLRDPYRVARAYLRRNPRLVYPFGNGYYEDTSGFASTVHILLGGRHGTVTVLDGSTSSTGNLVYSGPGGPHHPVSFKLPANWYFQIETSHGLAADTVFETFGKQRRAKVLGRA
jgi:4-amino-4-deoxy-L-arabinose transferase-like glycosyltransferase